MQRASSRFEKIVAFGSRLAFALVAAGALSGCAAVARYAATAHALEGTKRSARMATFAGAWRPLSRDDSSALSDDERVRARFYLDSCVNELAARFDRPPQRALRAAQIEDCMQMRGWHLVVEDVPARR